MLKGIIFDMDGVLVDNTEYHARAFDVFLKRHGIEKKFTSEYLGRTNDYALNSLMPEKVKEKGLRPLSDEKEAIYRELARKGLKPMKGLNRIVENARQLGIRCAVGSSGCMANIEFVTDEICGIRESIDVICCEDDVTEGKPSPEVYLKCCERLGLAPSECIVFEDSEAGIEAGHRAGCKVVALTTSHPREKLEQTHADMIADDFDCVGIEELKKLAEKA